MIVLGIDPGTHRMGYGLIAKEGGRLSFLDAGILSVEAKSHGEMLKEIKREIDKLILKFSPDLLAIERLYFSNNQKTAFSVAEARGIILLSAMERGVKVVEYTPSAVKMGLTGYGAADKQAVFKMVCLTLGMTGKLIDDASDALALAIVGSAEKTWG